MAATLHVVSLVSLADELRSRIEGIDTGVHLTVAAGLFDEEFRDTYGEYLSRRHLKEATSTRTSRAERDELLAGADVVLVGYPVPVDLRARSPRLRWVHQTPAGASNLERCDLWGSDVVVTTSRGLGNTLAIAEYTVATFLYFSRGLHQAAADRVAGQFDRSGYRGVQLAGKTVCVVGAGGIGQDIGRLCAALGMRVVGTRRSPNGAPPEGFAEVRRPDGMLELLAEASFVAVCCQRTPETEGLIGVAAFAALPQGAVLVNVARGEIIDEAALAEALAANRLRGVGIDVYVGEFERQPPPALWADPRVLITPHVSGASDIPSPRPIDLFCHNLQALLEGRPLRNVIDWDRGY